MATFLRGLKPTPKAVLAAAPKHKPRLAAKDVPAQVAYVPKQLSMWNNDQYGCCVTSEEAFAKAAYSIINGGTEVFVPDSVVLNWANAGGYLNGANLTDVMDSMIKSGFQIGSQLYNDGSYATVDYTNEAALKAALAEGPVKTGIDANALPSGAGNNQGWVAIGGSPGQFSNEDHCVGLAGYGPAGWLFAQLGVPLPSNLQPTQPGYLLFTWSTIGFVDHAWIMSTMGEAWIRTPTTVGVPPLPGPAPTPTPTPTPTPGPEPIPGPTPVTVDPTLNVFTALAAGTYVVGSVSGFHATPITTSNTISVPQGLSPGTYTIGDVQSAELVKGLLGFVDKLKAQAINPTIIAAIKTIIADLIPIIGTISVAGIPLSVILTLVSNLLDVLGPLL